MNNNTIWFWLLIGILAGFISLTLGQLIGLCFLLAAFAGWITAQFEKWSGG